MRRCGPGKPYSPVSFFLRCHSSFTAWFSSMSAGQFEAILNSRLFSQNSHEAWVLFWSSPTCTNFPKSTCNLKIQCRVCQQNRIGGKGPPVVIPVKVWQFMESFAQANASHVTKSTQDLAAFPVANAFGHVPPRPPPRDGEACSPKSCSSVSRSASDCKTSYSKRNYAAPLSR